MAELVALATLVWVLTLNTKVIVSLAQVLVQVMATGANNPRTSTTHISRERQDNGDAGCSYP